MKRLAWWLLAVVAFIAAAQLLGWNLDREWENDRVRIEAFRRGNRP